MNRCCGCRFRRTGQIERKLWMSTIAAMRRTSAWWSFSACDRRLTPMISRLGSAWVDVWVTSGRRTKMKEYWIGRKQKEEEMKKKRERKKSRKERKKRKKRKKRESDRWDVRFGAHNLQLFTNMPPNIRFWVMKTSETCFHFLSSSLIFLSDRITKTGSPNMSDESKQNVFCGSHQFWMMSDENRIISLKIACIQTTSKWLTASAIWLSQHREHWFFFFLN